MQRQRINIRENILQRDKEILPEKEWRKKYFSNYFNLIVEYICMPIAHDRPSKIQKNLAWFNMTHMTLTYTYPLSYINIILLSLHNK